MMAAFSTTKMRGRRYRGGSDASAAPAPAPRLERDQRHPDGLRGAELIGEFVKQLPNSPGVYRMFNEAGDVLYVGKARSLKKRVSNYARGRPFQPHRPHDARDGEYGIRHHAHRDRGAAARSQPDQALRPRFNVLLRDDKSFPYILITGDHEAPQISKHRGARSARAIISAPSPRRAPSAAPSIRCSAPSCCAPARTAFYESRTRPCLLYQIKRCSAPCTGEISDRGLWRTGAAEAKDFLSGKSQKR
jgi:excinuclease ABC subunit C